MAYELDKLDKLNKLKNIYSIVGLRGIDEVRGVEEIERTLKSKSSSLVINLDNNSRVNYLEVGIELARELREYSLLLSLFERYIRVSSI